MPKHPVFQTPTARRSLRLPDPLYDALQQVRTQMAEETGTEVSVAEVLHLIAAGAGWYHLLPGDPVLPRLEPARLDELREAYRTILHR